MPLPQRSITHAILGLFQETYKPACHAYSTIVDSFMIVSFFLEKYSFRSIIFY